MAYSAAEYIKMFLSLFPWGKAWSREADGTIYSLSTAHAQELRRLDVRSDALKRERDTRKTLELLSDHERDLGLPDECSELSSNVATRKLIAYTKLTAEGGLHKQVYIDIADDLGFTIIIDEFTPCWCGLAESGDLIGDQNIIFYWQINVYISPDSWVHFTSGGSSSGDMITYVSGTVELQCILNKYKPAHTIIVWNYYGPEFSAAFSFDFNSLPSTDSAWLQGAFNRDFDSAFDIYYGGGEFETTAFDDSFYKPM